MYACANLNLHVLLQVPVPGYVHTYICTYVYIYCIPTYVLCKHMHCPKYPKQMQCSAHDACTASRCLKKHVIVCKACHALPGMIACTHCKYCT